MTHERFKTIIAVVIVLNLALVAWLLLRSDPSADEVDTQNHNELLSAPTLSDSRYDIQDRALSNIISFRRMHFALTTQVDTAASPQPDQFAEEAAVFHEVTWGTVDFAIPHVGGPAAVMSMASPTSSSCSAKIKRLKAPFSRHRNLSRPPHPKGICRRGPTGGAGVQGKYGFRKL